MVEKVRRQGQILSHKLIKSLINSPFNCIAASVFLVLPSDIITAWPNVTFKMGKLQADIINYNGVTIVYD